MGTYMYIQYKNRGQKNPPPPTDTPIPYFSVGDIFSHTDTPIPYFSVGDIFSPPTDTPYAGDIFSPPTDTPIPYSSVGDIFSPTDTPYAGNIFSPPIGYGGLWNR